MGFYWIGLIFWGSLFISFIMLIYALVSRSSLWMMISGIFVIPFTLYFAGSPTLWWIAFTPILYFIVAILFYSKNRKSS